MVLKIKRIIGTTAPAIIIGKKGREKHVARIDTGAKFCSIDQNIAEKLDFGDVVKTKVIKSANGASSRKLKKCIIKINDVELRTEATMAERSNLKYKVLIGRNFLKKSGFLIDPSKGTK
jgi:hypothetical protein